MKRSWTIFLATVTLCLSLQHASAIDASVVSFLGKYKGNVSCSFGNLCKTGRLHVTEEGRDIKIASHSMFVKHLEVSMSRADLEQFFSQEKKEIVIRDDGKTEERVSF